MSESLDAILKGTNTPEAPVEVTKAEETPATPEPEQTKADRERDEQGRFKAKQEAEARAKEEAKPAKVEKPAPTAVEKPKEPADDPPHVPVKAMQEERKKRQELERQLAQLRQQQQKPPPDVIQDPEGFRQHIQSDLRSQLENERVNMSAAWAKRQYQDYESVMETWFQLTADNPVLYAQATKQDLPADWAYQHAKRHLLLQEIGDPTQYRQKLESELEAKLREKFEAEYAAKAPRAPVSVPAPSLANATSSGRLSTAEPAWGGPTPLTKLLRR